MMYLLEGILILGFAVGTTVSQDFNFNLSCKLYRPKSEIAAKNANYYCELIGGTPLDSTCVSLVKPYFQEINESEDSIKQFVEIFYEKTNMRLCTLMLIRFQNLCYDMERAVQLSKLIPVSWLRNNYKKLDLNYFTYERYTNNPILKSIQIKNCVGDINNTLEILKMFYVPWLISESGNADCTCEEVMGLRGFFPRIFVAEKNEHVLDPNSKFYDLPSSGLTKTSAAESAKSKTKENNLTLHSVYKDFCFYKNDKKNERRQRFWNTKQVFSLAKSKASYNEKLRLFLNGSNIGKAGWLVYYAQRNWNAEFIMSNLSWSESVANYNYNEIIDLMTAAFNIPCTEEDYLYMIYTISNNKFVSVKCMTDLINYMLSRSYSERFSMYKHTFMRFISIVNNLATIFKQTYPNENCPAFVERVPSLLDEIVGLDITEMTLEKRLEDAVGSKTEFNDVIQTLKK